VATAAEPQPASLPLPGGEHGATVRLHPLLSGISTAPPGWFYRESGRLAPLRALGIGVPKSDLIDMSIQAFLVEHPGEGPILIDTGFHPSVAVDPKQSLGRVGARAFHPTFSAEDAVAAQLRERGIEAREIGLVVMTHLHIDHASGVSEFPAATFVVDRREWEAATEPQGWKRGYRPRQFDHAFDWRLVDFDSPEVDSYATFGRSYDLLGDGSIRLVSTPGHTRGHMSVILRTGEREVLVAGDAIYTRRSLERGEVPYQVDDEHRFRRSVKEIQLFHETRHDALVIPGHELDFWKTLDAVYE
jgi:glyoxylase-like metal-dependent hydrolase (beta-lactamase superfamily II)